jgi:ubiquinol-cytochrome c reductase subunit 6
MSLSSFFSSFVNIVHADAPEEKTEVVPHVEQQKEEEEPAAEDSAEEPAAEEEEEEEPEDVRAFRLY